MIFSLEARELSVVFGGQTVLDIPSLGLSAGEALVIIGPNGSGKTTLLLSLALLLRPASGTIFYQGQPVRDGAEALRLRRQFAVVFQEPLLLNGTVWDNVTLGMRMRGVEKEEIKLRGRRWLERFGVLELSGRQARTLSGGEAKRVSLARAFALQPKILFLDEPFAALDTPTHQALLEDFEGVLRETGVSTIMATHDHDEALMLGDRVAVLMGGRIRQMGSPQEVFSAPADEEVASFIKAGNVLRGVVTAQSGGLASVKVNEHQLEAVSNLAIGTEVTVYLHYEDVTVSSARGGPAQSVASSARNHLKGTITRILLLGSQVRVTVNCPFPLAALITRRSYEELRLEIGQMVEASFKASAIQLFTRHGLSTSRN